MASIAKQNRNGKPGWRAQVARAGVRKTKVFGTKREAQDWAARQEYLILNGDKIASGAPFSEILDRYAREVSVKKRGARWEVLRIERLIRDDPIAQVRLGDLAAADLSSFRERRLAEVSPGTVRREMGLLSSILGEARKEWGLMNSNPMAGVRRPAEPAGRDRLPTPIEFKALALSAGEDLHSAMARAHHAFLFACETALRAGEIVGLTWNRVDLERRVAQLPMTKNGTAREVPLSGRAIELLRELPELTPVFGLTRVRTH